jgi:hydroxymethylglutaryl-CoA reductase
VNDHLVFSELPALADVTRARFAKKAPGRSDIDVLCEIIAESELVVGIYSDADDALGFNICVIKGEAILQQVMLAGAESAVVFAVIPCRERDEALAMRTVFGDGQEDDAA